MRRLLLTAPIDWQKYFGWPALDDLPISISSPIYGLEFLSENLSTDHVLLDYPSWDQYLSLLKSGDFTDIGVSFTVNHMKIVEKMVEAAHGLTDAKIVGGGHGVFSLAEFEKQLFDDVCTGWGVEWMKNWLGEPGGTSTYSLPISDMIVESSGLIPKPNVRIGLIVGNVGCPLGCDFCQITQEYPQVIQAATPSQAVDHMRSHKRPIYFFQDDNFFLHKGWVEEFITQRIDRNEDTPWLVWASANLLKNYDIIDLSQNGLLGVYIGYERRNYPKSRLAEELTEKLRGNDILILGSFILGWKDQTYGDIEKEIEWALSLECDAYFFACYTPLPGTTGGEEIMWDEIDFSKIGSGEELIWNHPNLQKKWLENKISEAYERAGMNFERIFRVMSKKIKKV